MAALYVPVYLAVLALPLPLEVAEPGVETSRVELMTNEVVGIEVIAVPTWTSKYMAWKCIREKRWGLASCILVALRRTHRDGFAELAGLFETFGRDVRVNKKSRMHTDKLGWTYRYVVWKMENRYGDVGPGQVQGRQEIERLREQQDNVTGGIWYGKGKSAGVSTCIKNSPGWLETRLDDLPMWSRRGA